MKKITLLSIVAVVVVILSSFLLAGCAPIEKKLPKNGQKFNYDPNEWEITFQDNFDGTELDRTKWRVGTMMNENEPDKNGVRRAGYYVDEPSNLFVKDGNLTIRTNWQENGTYGAGWYTSWLETSTGANASMPVAENYKGFSQAGGYFEIKCKAPASTGIWSAFWLMPDEGVAFTKNDIQGTAEDGLEIDIMESPYYYQNKKGACTHVLHCDGYDERLKSTRSNTYLMPDMYTEMHTYALEWSETEYKFYIDGILTWKTKHEYKGKVFNVAKVAEYMILSVEVGGHRDKDGNMIPGFESDGSECWAGNPNDNDKTKNYDFVIDSVKVMKRK